MSGDPNLQPFGNAPISQLAGDAFSAGARLYPARGLMLNAAHRFEDPH